MLADAAQGIARGRARVSEPFALPSEARTKLELWRAASASVVFTNGVFDLLHRGHVEYLEDARALGDRLVIGLNTDELDLLGGRDAGAVARALVAKGEMTVWQYGVRRGPNGELQQAPTQKIGLLANSSLRVEPYTTPYTIVAHE